MRGDIINKLRKAEEEIENGEGIDSDVAFKELRQNMDINLYKIVITPTAYKEMNKICVLW